MAGWFGKLFGQNMNRERDEESSRRDDRFRRRYESGDLEELLGLGEGVTGATVLTVHVTDGDTVADGQPVIEVETEKAAMDVPASRAMRIVEMAVEKNDWIMPGQVIAAIEPLD